MNKKGNQEPTQTAKLQAVLFTSGAPVTKKRLMSVLPCRGDELEQLLKELRSTLQNSGLDIIDDGTKVALATSPDMREYITQLQQEDRTAPLSQASQETLAIIVYGGPIAKTDLDFLRGVNTQYTVRRLMIRALIQESKVEKGRMFTVTVDLLRHLGVRTITELPEYESIRKSIQDGLVASREEESE